jgi:hypothetical protein
MKKFTPNFITKIVTTLAILPIIAAPAPAKAGGCYPALAADEIANLVRGGVDGGDAIRESIRRGHIDSEMCARQTLGYMRNHPYVFGDVLN